MFHTWTIFLYNMESFQMNIDATLTNAFIVEVLSTPNAFAGHMWT